MLTQLHSVVDPVFEAAAAGGSSTFQSINTHLQDLTAPANNNCSEFGQKHKHHKHLTEVVNKVLPGYNHNGC